MWKVLPANIPCAFVLLFPIRWQNNFSDAGARALSNFRVTTLFWVFHLLWVSFFSGVALTPAARTQSQSEFMVRPGGWLFTIILSYDRRWSFWGAALPCKTSSKWYELSATEKRLFFEQLTDGIGWTAHFDFRPDCFVRRIMIRLITIICVVQPLKISKYEN